MSRLIRLVLLITLGISLATCGQKGPLRRPDAGNLAALAATAEPQLR